MLFKNISVQSLWRWGIGMMFLLFALALPQHLATIDLTVLEYAGENSMQLDDKMEHLITWEIPGPVELISEAVNKKGIDARMVKLYEDHPHYRVTGGSAPYYSQYLKLIDYQVSGLSDNVSIMKVVIPQEHREELLLMLESSNVVSVQSILRTRGLTSVSRFMPVYTAAGAPLDASILVTALLLQGNYLSETVQKELKILADSASSGDLANVDRLEQFYLSVLGMGFRMNWMQFVSWARNCHDLDAFIRSVSLIHKWPEHFSKFYSASLLIGDFGAIAKYVERYNAEEGVMDIEQAMYLGEGALQLLIDTNRPIFHGRGWMGQFDEYRIFPSFCYFFPKSGIAMKLISIFLCTYFFITAMICLSSRRKRDSLSSREALPELRNVLLSLLFSVLLLALVEPGRSYEEGPEAETASIHLNIANIVNDLNYMNNITTDLTTILVLILFFILQLIIYFIGLRKIEQIRRGDESADLKLKIIDNEDNLFDCGLYVGLGGTVASLILLAMDVVSASLVAAYASTLFGIIFVAILKIFHVRPYRRMLILKCEKTED